MNSALATTELALDQLSALLRQAKSRIQTDQSTGKINDYPWAVEWLPIENLGMVHVTATLPGQITNDMDRMKIIVEATRAMKHPSHWDWSPMTTLSFRLPLRASARPGTDAAGNPTLEVAA